MLKKLDFGSVLAVYSCASTTMNDLNSDISTFLDKPLDILNSVNEKTRLDLNRKFPLKYFVGKILYVLEFDIIDGKDPLLKLS